MRLAAIAGAATILIALAGCGARNPVVPVEGAGSGAGAADPTFVLSSALDPRLPGPMAEAEGATAADLAITGAASIARGDPREGHPRASADPVVFWNQLTTGLARGAGLPPPRFARAYALTHVAIFDALIAGEHRARGGLTGPALAAGAASTVLTYLFPNAAADIAAAAEAQLGGSDRRSVLRSWRLDAQLPSYTSGHSTISAAAAAVMGELFPRDARFFRDQAAEAAISRLWGGIHITHDNNEGLRVGRRIGEKAVRVMRHGFGDGFVAEDRD